MEYNLDGLKEVLSGDLLWAEMNLISRHLGLSIRNPIKSEIVSFLDSYDSDWDKSWGEWSEYLRRNPERWSKEEIGDINSIFQTWKENK